MVHVVPNILEFELAIVIVGMHLLGHWFVKTWVKEAQKLSALGRSQIEHQNQPAHVEENQHCDHPVDPLLSLITPIFKIGFKVAE